MTEKCNNKLVVISFLLLFLLLFLLYLPSFSNPPHVDYWEAFFTFHQVDSLPSLSPWPYIVNHDPWRHGTFRPLSYTLLYLEHRAFGSSFVWNHVTNFICYCLLLILLFQLGRRLGARELELGGFLGVYAVLYSHCDILTLTFHIFLVAAWAGFVGAFLLYIRYLEREKTLLLLLVGFLFLFSMLCYETFFLWPPAILILFFAGPRTGRRKRRLLPTLLMLGTLYSLYGAVFILTRFSSHLSGDLSSIPLSAALIGLVFSLFNLLYTGLGVNLFPILAFPGRYRGFSEMLGVIPLGRPPWLIPLAYGFAAAVLILSGVIVLLLIKRKKYRFLSATAFLGFLYLTNFSLLIAARSTTSDFSHILRQFRYQLIPNALVMLFAAVAVSSLFRPTRRVRMIVFSVLLAVFLVNIYFTRAHVLNITARLAPLRELLCDIRTGIKGGDISPERRLYLPDGFATSFPRLCWNRGMGRRMWGTYQWVFSPAELACFSLHREDAYWTIDLDDGVYVKR